MKLDKLFDILLFTGSVLLFFTIPAQSDEVKGRELEQVLTSASKSGNRDQSLPLLTSTQPVELSKKIRRLSEIKHPLTSSQMLVQSPALSSEVLQVTGVKINRTDKGIEVILETRQGQQLQITNRSAGNSFIADIPNAQLRLVSSNSFRQEKPTAGITEVIVRNQDANTIRVTATGKTGLPQVELFDSNEGLILSFIPIASSSQQPPQTQPTPSARKPQPSAQDEEPIELVVTGTRTEETLENIPRSVTIITHEQIQQQAQLNRNITEILPYLVPGFLAPTGRPGYFGLRGGGASVIVDGVPQVANSTDTFGSNVLTGIDPDNIERIEVINGANAIYGGQATGGLINIITRKPSKEKVTSTAEIGLNTSLRNSEDAFGYNLRYELSGTQGIFDFFGGLSVTTQGAYYDALGDRVANNFGFDDTTTINPLLKFGLNFSEDQRLELRFTHSSLIQDTDFTDDPSTLDIPGIQKARRKKKPEGTQIIGYEDGDRQNSTDTTLVYTNENLLGSRVQAQGFYRTTNNGGFQPYDNRPFDGGTDITSQSGNTEQLGGRLQIQTPFNQQKTISLLWGVDYDRQQISQTANIFDTTEYDASGGRIYRKIGEIKFIPPYTFNDLGIFAQLQGQLGNFTFSGGARYVKLTASVDDYTAYNFGVTEPRDIEGGTLTADDVLFNLGGVYKITDKIGLFASFSQGFSFPDIGRILRSPEQSFVSLSDSVELTSPIDVNNYEIGIRGNWNNLQASLSGFYSKSDLGFSLVYNENGRLVTVRSPQRNYGIEASLDWQPIKTLRLGGTVGWTEGEDDQNDDGKFLPLSSLDPLKLTAYIQHQTTSGWSNRLQLLYIGNRSRAFDQGVDPLPVTEYSTVDYISSIKLGGGELQIGIQNLFNTYYFPVYSQTTAAYYDALNYAGAGRSLSVGYRISW
ncbi:TonB-dependent receptor domain-containing protein [Nostoc sp.]|uniref:TonB-dependent receptor domain-containing protein n=1 Tax=Nostoc sp. TaxID=1180 RepID=UPI002FFD3543